MTYDELERLRRWAQDHTASAKTTALALKQGALRLLNEVEGLRAENDALRQSALSSMTAEGQCIEEHHWKGNCPAEAEVQRLQAELKEAQFLAQAAGPKLKWKLRYDTKPGGKPPQGTPVVVTEEDP